MLEKDGVNKGGGRPSIKVGDRFFNNYGSEYEVIDYINKYNVTVKFIGSGYVKSNCTSTYVKNGTIHCPFDKKHYGIGYMGLNKDGSEIDLSNVKRERSLWNIMLRRCYSDSSLNYNPTYEGCQVSERWQCFANFLEDLPKIEGYDLWKISDDYHLDKDVKGNSKLYSLETCKFIHSSSNARERMLRKDNPNPEKQVVGVNMETGEATLYHGVRVAQRAVGGKHHSGIGKSCSGIQKYAYGHYWFYFEDFVEQYPNKEYNVYSSSKEESWEKQNMNTF